jgi:hypothetical protein
VSVLRGEVSSCGSVAGSTIHVGTSVEKSLRGEEVPTIGCVPKQPSLVLALPGATTKKRGTLRTRETSRRGGRKSDGVGA